MKTSFNESDSRLEIDEALKNKGWVLHGSNKNVYTEVPISSGRADYILKSQNRENPLIVVEAKRRGKDLNEALEQALRYAEALKAPIVYASDGSTTKTLHIKTRKPLVLNGEEVDHFITESVALQYLSTNEYTNIGDKIVKSRKELISVFTEANRQLRREGLQAGMERFGEFCNILFLKIFSEQVELLEREKGLKNHIPLEYRWNFFKNKDGNELLSYVNDIVIEKFFQKEYGSDIFSPLKIKNPTILKKIIDNLDPLSLVSTSSDIKGDAFEYFLKAYLANQKKDLGEYFTPRHIVKTLVKLINPKFGESIYDPFCGTGGMLIESFKHIYNKMPMSEDNLQILKTKTIFGGEITNNARITKMNMILTGDGHNNIVKQDSLKNISQKKYDIVITNMPFSLGNFNEYSGLYKLGSPNGNSLCIEHCFDAINKDSSNPRIGIIVPEGILFDKKFRRLREYIYKNSYVQNIISLPSGAFKPYTDVKTSILYLTQVNKKKDDQKSVWQFSVENDGHTLNTKREEKPGVNDIDIFLSFNNIEDHKKLLEIGFNKLDMELIKNNDYVSILNPYKRFEFNSNYEMTLLGDLIEESHLRNGSEATVWSVTNRNGGQFISQKDVFDENVASENTENYKLILNNYFAYNPSRVNVGSIALNETNMIGCVSPMYSVFKVFSEEKLLSKYLYHLLQSDSLKEQIKTYAFGSVRQTLNFSDLCKIQIPVPSIEEQKKIVEQLDNIQKSIDSANELIESLRLGGGGYYGLYGKKTESYPSVRLGDILVLEYGKGLTEAQRHGDKYPVLGSNGIVGYHDEYLIEKPCIIVGRKGSAGKITLIEENCYPIDTTFYLKWDKNLVNYKYLYYSLNKLDFERLINGTGVPGLNRNDAYEMLIPLPPLEEQKEIVERLEIEEKYIEQSKEFVARRKDAVKSILSSLWQS